MTVNQSLRQEHPKRLPTVAAIQADTKRHDGFVPKSCWIADVKVQMGYKVRPAWNRRSDARAVPCPADRVEPIKRSIWRLMGQL